MELTEQELPIKVDSVAVKLTETVLPILAYPLFVLLLKIKLNCQILKNI